MDYKNYNPRQAALTEARALLTDAAKAAVADGALPPRNCPISSSRSRRMSKHGDVSIQHCHGRCPCFPQGTPPDR